MKRATLVYLSSYLFIGGVGFAFIPKIVLELFMSTGNYGDIMPRVVGMFMIVLSFLITLFVRNEDYKYYLATISARTFIVIFLSALYFNTKDPLFIILNIIVLVGLIPSAIVYFMERSEK